MGHAWADVPKYGFTPNNLYPLWNNINIVIEKIALLYPPEVQTEFSKIEVEMYAGKSPSDVLMNANNFVKIFNTFLFEHNMPSINLYDFDMLNRAEITPSEVYIYSGEVLDKAVKALLDIENKYKVQEFYKIIHVMNKAPSDVYGLTELAKNRMNLLLQSALITKVP